MPDPSLIARAHGRRTELSISISIPTIDLLTADRDARAAMLADAALHLSEEEPNKAVAVLIGSALDTSCRGEAEHVALALAAAVHLLAGIAASQLEMAVEL